MSIKISPSLLSADFANLGAEVVRLADAGADMIHIDVMDGQFVPNLTIGPSIIKAVRKYTKVPFDVHLMIDRPERYIKDFASAGSDLITVHYEATNKLHDVLKAIRNAGCKAGLSIVPSTPASVIELFINDIDLILVMTVNPGFGGQSFMHDQLEKIKTLKSWRDQGLGTYLIEVDGGVDEVTSKLCWAAGADILVAGSAVFKGEKIIENYRQNIEALKI